MSSSVSLPIYRREAAVDILHQAMFWGNMDVIIKLLAHGLDLNYPRGFRDKEYGVDKAAYFGQLDIMKLFLDCGGRSSYPGVSGFDRAFYNAHLEGYWGILTSLEQHTGWSTPVVISSLLTNNIPRKLGWVGWDSYLC